MSAAASFIAQAADVPAGRGRVVEAEGKSSRPLQRGRRLLRSRQCLRATAAGRWAREISTGTVVDGPWHAWRWDVNTGANVNNPAVKIAPASRCRSDGGRLRGAAVIRDCTFARPARATSASPSPTAATCGAACCMPEEECAGCPAPTSCSFEEIGAAGGRLRGLGVDKVRLTGGEPLLRRIYRSLGQR